MKCVVLQNSNGEQLGFMLCSPGLDELAGDCVFMGVPGPSDLLDDPAAEQLIQRCEAVESSWEVTSRDPLSVAVRTPGLSVEMFIEIDSTGEGSWGVVSGLDRQSVGRVVLPSIG